MPKKDGEEAISTDTETVAITSPDDNYQMLTKDEFMAVSGRRAERTTDEFTTWVQTLSPNTGFRAPCKWVHSNDKPTVCPGSNRARTIARRAKFSVSTRCKDQTLYIFRSDGLAETAS